MSQDVLVELEQLRKDIGEAEREVARHEAVIEQIEGRIKESEATLASEFKVKTVDEAEQMLASEQDALRKRVEALRGQLGEIE